MMDLPSWFRAAIVVLLAAVCPAAAPFLVAAEVETPPGLVATPAAEPGLVKHPMMAALDDAGRLYVAESSGVNLKKEELEAERPHSIRLLTDTDGDGVYDRATTFADKLTFPQGSLWVDGSLYVMSPPSLWRFADKDGDGRAEVREEMVTGFDYTGNAADVHGPFLHPAGRLFWCHGRKGHEVRDPDTGELISKGKAARIWSCDINGGDVRAFAGGGMDNPVELDFTEDGDLIGTVNLFYGRPRGDVLVHWRYGGAYPRRDQQEVLTEFKRSGDLLGEVHNFGHVAISGMCRYRSGALDPEWKDQWLTTHFNTAEVTRTVIRKAGASYEAGETESIFKLNKPDAHITDVLEDRNGDLLVLDTGGWFRIGCPTSQIAKPDIGGGIYRLCRKGKTYAAPESPPWPNLTAEAVADRLDNGRAWIRERAMTELAMRGHPAIPELRRILRAKSSSPMARRNAVWTLARMKFSASPDLIFEALTDSDASVRKAACLAVAATRTWQEVAAHQPAERQIELARNATIAGGLARIARSDEPGVVAAAATALGNMAEVRAIGALFGAAGRSGGDRSLQHALTDALIRIDDFGRIRHGLESENPGQLVVALWALDQMDSSRIEALDALPLLESPHEAVREAALAIAARHPEWDAAVANRFLSWRENLTRERRDLVLALGPTFIGTPPMIDFVTALFQEEAADPDGKRKSSSGLAFRLVATGRNVPFASEWEEPFRRALTSDDPGPALDALASTPNSDAARFSSDLEAIAVDEKRPAMLRVRALRAQETKDGALDKRIFDLLLSLLDGDDHQARSEAIDVLADSRLTGAMRLALAEKAPALGPLELPRVFDLYPRRLDEESAHAVARALLASSGLRSLPPERVRQLFINADEKVVADIEKRLAEIEAENAARAEKISSLEARLAEGDPERGKATFAQGKGTCMLCHLAGDTGRDIGPNLSTIGRIRTGRDLLESVLFPSASIARDFETHSISFRDGSPPFIGLIRSTSAKEIEVVDPAGQVRTLDRAGIDAITTVETSLMPQGLDAALEDGELLDIVAYLLSLK